MLLVSCKGLWIRRICELCFLTVLFLALPASAETLTGRVVAVTG